MTTSFKIIIKEKKMIEFKKDSISIKNGVMSISKDQKQRTSLAEEFHTNYKLTEHNNKEKNNFI